MKKVYAFILVLAMLLSLSACSGLPSSSQTSEESHQVDDSQNAQEVRDDSKPSANAMPVDGEAEGSDEQSQTDTGKNDEENDSPPASGIRPEFKEAMDTYEAFYEEYCEFMTEYGENPTDITLLKRYSEILIKMEKMNAAFEAWDDDEMSGEELKYYLDVNNRVMQ